MSEPTKRCAACGERKPWGEFYARTRWDDGSMRSPQSRCKRCAGRARAAQKRALQGEAREAIRRYMRAWRANASKDPEYLLRERVAHARKRRRSGAVTSPYRPRPASSPVDVEFVPLLDAGPLRETLLPLRPRWETTTAMSRAIGMDDSQLAQLLTGRKAFVTLDTADRVLCRLGHPELLNELYPLDEGELAA